MKITLKNFRCYIDSTFDFGEEGIALLSGSSGAGKTSILLGIYFALFGVGSKLVTFGKTSCIVILDFDGLLITRTKKPNRLFVKSIEGEYEDEAAQFIINKKFGDTFNTTGYISQNARDSFILMSPIEKLDFLEKFAFQDSDLSKIKRRCKDLIHLRNDTLLKTTSQLEVVTKMISELEKPEKVDFPLKCHINKRPIAIKNEITRNKNTSILIKRCKKKISLLQAELNSLKVYNASVQSKRESLDAVIEKISFLSIQKYNIEYEGNDKLQGYEEDLITFVSQRELSNLEKRYEEDLHNLNTMKKEEFNDIKSKIVELDNKRWNDYTKEDVKDTIENNTQIIKDLEKLQEFKNTLDRFYVDEVLLQQSIDILNATRKDIEDNNKKRDMLELQKEVYECPSCNTNLHFREEKLEVYKLDIDTDTIDMDKIDIIISKLKRKLSSLELSISSKKNKIVRYKEISNNIKDIVDQYDELPDMDEMKTDLEYIRNYNTSNIQIDNEIHDLQNKLDTNTYSSSIVSFEKSVKKHANSINVLKKNTSNKQENTKNIDEEQLRDTIITQKHNRDKIEEINSDIEKLTKEETNYKSSIEENNKKHIELYGSIRNEDDVSELVISQTHELTQLEEQKHLHTINIDKIEKYQEYQKSIDIYTSWETKIKILEKEEIENRNLYAAATLLKETILEAESIAMLNVISSINSHTQIYFDSFFPDNPISVKLVPFKETKKGKKPQINLQIEYKGMEADINMLSGGELSRVILAFALGLGEMFNTPIMLLDECTSSLDEELTGAVMDGIRENYSQKGKIVIIIAHQVVKGQFDKVIQIGE